MVQGLEQQVEELEMSTVEQEGFEAGEQYNVRNTLNKSKFLDQIIVLGLITKT